MYIFIMLWSSHTHKLRYVTAPTHSYLMPLWLQLLILPPSFSRLNGLQASLCLAPPVSHGSRSHPAAAASGGSSSAARGNLC